MKLMSSILSLRKNQHPQTLLISLHSADKEHITNMQLLFLQRNMVVVHLLQAIKSNSNNLMKLVLISTKGNLHLNDS